MIAPVSVKHYWDTREYAEMLSVGFDGNHLSVAFADGAVVSVDVARLRDYGIAKQEWSRAVIEDEAIVVPTTYGVAEIPWDVIRVLTDPAFDAYLGERSAETARIIGARFRGLRERRNLSLSDVADSTGIPTETIAELEAGQLASDLSLEERLLAAIGCEEDDLYTDLARSGERNRR